MDPEEHERNRTSLEDVLWLMERIIDFHGEDEYLRGFLRLRPAIAEARRLTQALGPPVILLQGEPVEVLVDEPNESLVIQIRTGTEGRTVSTVRTTTAQSREPGQ